MLDINLNDNFIPPCSFRNQYKFKIDLLASPTWRSELRQFLSSLPVGTYIWPEISWQFYSGNTWCDIHFPICPYFFQKATEFLILEKKINLFADESVGSFEWWRENCITNEQLPVIKLQGIFIKGPKNAAHWPVNMFPLTWGDFSS